MRRHGTAAGKAAKTGRRKAGPRKRRIAPKPAPKPAPSRGLAAGGLKGQLDRRTHELSEALEQQAATAEVQRVISASPGDLQPVFAVILENATRLCQANFGMLYLCEGNAYRAVAAHNVPPAYAEARQRYPIVSMTGNSALTRVAATKRAIQIADVAEDPAYRIDPQRRNFITLTGAHTLVVVPMLKDNELIGAIGIYRREVRSFTDKQVALLTNFAAQAVIAIENTRLLNELRERTTDLTESLEQQTAISEILRVISNSPSDVQPVLDSVAEHAARICEAQIVDIFLVENNMLRNAALFGDLARPISQPLDRSTVSGRSICDLRPIHVADLQNAGDEFPRRRDYAHRFGHRSTLAVPLIREGRPLGTILVRRTEVRPFEEKHIALLTTFADQAAIAIENVRLFEAEQQRTRELSESLEQQTATSEVLRVISSSPGELEPVFQTVLANAVRLCEAQFGNLLLCEGDAFRVGAMHNMPPVFAERF